MPHRFDFSRDVLHSVAGGRSVIDLPRLAFRNEKEADQFIHSYGFDLNLEADREQLWHFHRRSLVLLVEKLGIIESEIPQVLRDRKLLGNLRNLLLWASNIQPESNPDPTTKPIYLQKWSCAILRVMHAFVHSETDLFSSFTEEIQSQVLHPVQACVVNDGMSGKTFLQKKKGQDLEPLPLVAFQIKPFKTSSSSVIKLLAKSDVLAMNIYDRLGFRFVTENLFDSFRVLRFLVEENLVSYPHIIPDQSTNSLFPVDLFSEIAHTLQQKRERLRGEELDQYFLNILDEKKDEVSFIRKENQFSGADYRFIKFIARQLIHIPPRPNLPGSLKFFFPYEVQIMDQKSFAKIQMGPSHHDAYKERQKLAARKRVFPDLG